ncbi:MAG: choice-of-anchor I family protein [Saprospiraceae bacterium]
MPKSFLLALRATAIAMLVACAPSLRAQGLVISEILTNPSGVDSAKEFIELRATQFINFATTPYSVVFNNNGTATANGWIAGGSLTYGYNITSGTVNTGDVVYVGGTGMQPVGPRLRAINNVNTAGDGFGNANISGVLGNGGGNADGVAVFNVAIGSITPTTAPIDAVFFGTGIGTAVVSGGTAGYTLPVSDLYPGGFLQSSSFFAPDPASGTYLVATGTYDTLLNQWAIARTFASAGAYTSTSSVSLTGAAPPASVSFSGTHQTVLETAGTATVNLTVANANGNPSSIDVEVVTGTATLGADFTFAATTVNIPASANGTYPVTINLTDDTDTEATEYVFLRLVNPVNANVIGTNQYTFYIKDNDATAPTASNELALNLLGNYSNGTAGTNAAEVVEYDPATKYLYIANSIGKKIDIYDLKNPAAAVLLANVSIASYGNINSVAAKNGIVAAAIENSDPQMPGKVVFFDSIGNFLKEVPAGAMPDMITFNNAGTKVYTANEGEPNAAYTSDPEGSVTCVDISNGVASATSVNIGFGQFVGQEAALRAAGVRIYGLNANAAQDFEPEYIAISSDDQTAYVTLQENNAIAVVDLTQDSVIEIRPLGYKDHSLAANALDASNVTSAVNIAAWPVKGMYLPDEMGLFTVAGQDYLVTANEGDARAYTAFNEEARVSALNLDPTAFPNGSFYKNNNALGRLLATNKTGDTDGDGDIDEIHVFGGRSFSIINASTGALVYESGDDFEQITANDPTFSAMFNASNGGSIVVKDRSDDKGPEPEGVAVGTIGSNQYAFVGLERIGGVMAFNVTDPAAPTFVTYVNNRNLATNGPDRGAEGLVFINAGDAPLGQEILVVANEVSSTFSIYAVCAGGGTLQTWYADTDGDGFGGTQTTQACTLPTGYSANSLDCNDANANVYPGATDLCNNADDNCNGLIDEDGIQSFTATPSGFCSTTKKIVVSNIVAPGSGAPFTYSKDGGATFQTSPTFSGLAPGTYTVVVKGANGCTASQTITFEPNIVLTASSTNVSCFGSNDGTATAIVTGGTAPINFEWTLGSTPIGGNTATLISLDAGTYKVKATDANGCFKTATAKVTEPKALVIKFKLLQNKCNGQATGRVIATVTGGVPDPAGTTTDTRYDLAWSNGSTNDTIANLPAGNYILTVTDHTGCQATATAVITEPTAVEITGITSTPNGANFSVTIAATGGTPNAGWPTGYRYRRTPGSPSFTTANPLLNVPAGTYTFVAQDKNQCLSAPFEATIPTTNLTPAADDRTEPELMQVAENQLFISPNPASEFLQIRAAGTQGLQGQIFVVDASGRTVLTDDLALEPSETVQITLDRFAAGLYRLTFIGQDGRTESKPFVVVKN